MAKLITFNLDLQNRELNENLGRIDMVVGKWVAGGANLR